MTKLPELPRPVMCARAGFHADHARRQLGNQWQQLISRNLRLDQLGSSSLIHAMNCKNILGKINPYRDNAHDFPLLFGLDENVHFHLGTFDVVRGNFTAPSGRGSPFHSLGNKQMAPEDQPDVQFTITSDEAIVLFEFLQRFSNTDKLGIEDQAEERSLWNLCCVFEKHLAMPFDEGYPELLREARERLRDEL